MTKCYKITDAKNGLYVFEDTDTGRIQFTEQPLNKLDENSKICVLKSEIAKIVFSVILEKNGGKATYEEIQKKLAERLSGDKSMWRTYKNAFQRTISDVFTKNLKKFDLSLIEGCRHERLFVNDRKSSYSIPSLRRCDEGGELLKDQTQKDGNPTGAFEGTDTGIRKIELDELKEIMFDVLKHVTSSSTGDIHQSPDALKDFIGKLTAPVVYEDGTTYIGEWKNGMPHGRGTMIWSHEEEQDELGWVIEEESYNGDFQNGKRHGKGRLYILRHNKNSNLIEECSYDGEWKADLKHGVGVAKLNDLIISGHWMEDHKTGNYVIYDVDGRIITKEKFRGGSEIYKYPDGKVQLKRHDGTTEIMKYPDGKVELSVPGASAIIVINPSGKVVLSRDDETDEIIRLPDGELIMSRPDNSVEFIILPDGNFSLCRRDGTHEIVRFPDGKIRLERPDGTTEIIKYPDGKVRLCSPDKTAEIEISPDWTLLLSGSITCINHNGEPKILSDVKDSDIVFPNENA